MMVNSNEQSADEPMLKKSRNDENNESYGVLNDILAYASVTNGLQNSNGYEKDASPRFSMSNTNGFTYFDAATNRRNCLAETFSIVQQYIQNRLSVFPDPNYGQNLNNWLMNLSQNDIDIQQVLNYIAKELHDFSSSLDHVQTGKAIQPGGLELVGSFFERTSKNGPALAFNDQYDFEDDDRKSFASSSGLKQAVSAPARKSRHVEMRQCRSCKERFNHTHEKNYVCSKEACQARVCKNCNEDRIIYAKAGNYCRPCSQKK